MEGHTHIDLSRFAQTTLSIYKAEGSFELDLLSREEALRAKCEFEKLGCHVTVSPYGSRLIVRVPGHWPAGHDDLLAQGIGL